MACKILISSERKRIVSKYSRYVNSVIHQYKNVPPCLIYAVIKQETGGYELHNWNDPKGGAHGAMQILLGTAQMYRPNITYQELTKPENNIPLGIRLLSELINQYKTTDAKTIYAHYNGGGNPPSISFSRGECVKNNEQLFANYLHSFTPMLQMAGFPMKPILVSIGVLAILGSIYIIVRKENRNGKL